MPGEKENLKQVSRFEANLLRILHFLLRRDPAGQALELIYQELDPPPCLSRACVELVQDTLKKGCVGILARSGGWQQERHLRQGQVVAGRLWDRHPVEELALDFSENTLGFLRWLTAENPGSKKPSWPSFKLNELADGDRLFFYLAFGELRETEGERFFSSKELFFTNALCPLACPEQFGNVPKNRPIDFTPWLDGTGAAILEALQPELAQHWLRIEKLKTRIHGWERMQVMGQAQERVLGSFFDALEKAGRKDLARFLLPVLQALLPENPKVEWWTGSLRNAGPRLMDRTETHRAALVLPRLMSRLMEWTQQARSVGYFDEDYAASQLWKSDWERWQGDVLYERAQSLLQQIEPLRR